MPETDILNPLQKGFDHAIMDNMTQNYGLARKRLLTPLNKARRIDADR